jgi:hypothetical protein
LDLNKRHYKRRKKITRNFIICTPPDVIRMTEALRTRMTGHVGCMEDQKNAGL